MINKTFTFDLETNGFLDVADTCWVMVLQDHSNNRFYIFTDHSDKYNGTISDGLSMLSNAKALVAHNGVGFDVPMLKKLFNWTPSEHTTIYDTWIFSEVLSYKRSHKHGIGGWGEHLGLAKIDFDRFDEFSDEMVEYCKRDVELNTQVYRRVLGEFQNSSPDKPLLGLGLKIEHAAEKFNTDIKQRGWKFDIDKAYDLLKTIQVQMKQIESRVEPNLGEITILIDKEPKTPKYTKAGLYTAATARMLTEHFKQDVFPEDALGLEPPIEPYQEFQRSYKEQATLGNMEAVKQYLLDNGWKPDDYNVKKDYQGNWIKTSPKLTTTSLEPMGQIGIDIDTYYTLRNRKSVIEGWIKHCQEGDGRLHGNMWVRGTPTFRARHEVIANLPRVDAVLGKEIRSLFLAEEGHKIVGADSAGNQARALCHYAEDNKLTEAVLHGDFHQFNADILQVERAKAKSFLYAYLFGAGNAKLGKVLTGVQNPAKGSMYRDRFNTNIPGLGKLNDRLKQHWANNNQTIPGLDGRPIFVPQDYQCLNYLLQSFEAITCKASLMYAVDKLKEEGIPAEPRLFMHDELAFDVPEEYAERVSEILVEAFTEGPKMFNVQIMSGDAAIGDTYAEVH